MKKRNSQDFQNMVDQLNRIPIVDYCDQKGIQLTKNYNYPSLLEHDSWVIDVRNNSFRWNSRGISGDTIKFVQTYYGVDFKTAVEELSGTNMKDLLRDKAAPIKNIKPRQNNENKIPEKPKIKFELDEVDGKYTRMYAYLIQKRGLSKKIVDEFTYKKLISQDTKGNINFKFKDENNKISYVKKGTTDAFFEYINPDNDIRSFRYTRNKNPENIERRAVYEAPIDLMSYLDMYGQNVKTAYIAMFGLKNTCVLSNLKDYPNIKELCLCVDNDEAGHMFIERFKELANTEEILKDIRIVAVIPEKVKDWNEMLAEFKTDPSLTKDFIKYEVRPNKVLLEEKEFKRENINLSSSTSPEGAIKNINKCINKVNKTIELCR